MARSTTNEATPSRSGSIEPDLIKSGPHKSHPDETGSERPDRAGMTVDQQGVKSSKRYRAVPRTLIFLVSRNPQSGEDEVLLLLGAPDKRLWANRYNGIGGHVEVGEDIFNAARRELSEETGIDETALHLSAVINIGAHPDDDPPAGVLVFAFWGRTEQRRLRAGAEGSLHWQPLARIHDLPLVDDLHQLVPMLSATAEAGTGLVYGHYRPLPDGSMAYSFVAEPPHRPATERDRRAKPSAGEQE